MALAHKPNVLFLCTGNSCRSQMAEGFARRLLADRINAFSAGIDPHGMNPRAMKVMAEAGFPIEDQHSKHVSDIKGVEFDYVLSVCGHADETCPALPGPARRIHRGFDDPPKLAKNAGSEDEALFHYRRVRDEIRRYVADSLLADLGKSEAMVAVKENYGQTARSGLTNDVAAVQAVAQAFGYTAEELTSIPAEANMALSCGNPVATAHLKAGEVVVDLGSGGGLDVFLAAQKVGSTGKAIGIDMTPDMIDRARRAASKGVNGRPIANVEFHLSTIDDLPLPDASVDVILSNCVINLAPEKQRVFREMYRVLKPGGRVAVSDIALKKVLPPELAQDLTAYVGCIAGALPIEEYKSGLSTAGFAGVTVVDSKSDLNAYSQVEGQTACCSAPAGTLPILGAECCGTSAGHESKAAVHANLAELIRRYNINDYAASVKVYAIKPASA